MAIKKEKHSLDTDTNSQQNGFMMSKIDKKAKKGKFEKSNNSKVEKTKFGIKSEKLEKPQKLENTKEAECKNLKGKKNPDQKKEKFTKNKAGKDLEMNSENSEKEIKVKKPQKQKSESPKKLKNEARCEQEAPEAKRPKMESPEQGSENKKSSKELKASKKEKNQEAKKDEPQFQPGKVHLTAEQLKERIELISARPTLTKTAKRKLAAARKKLQLLEQGILPEKKEGEASQSEKRHQRRTKMVEKLKAEGNFVPKKHDEKNDKVKPKNIKKQKSNETIQKKLKIQPENSDEEMEEDNESDAESDEGDVEMDESDEEVDENDEADSEVEDEDAHDDDEENEEDDDEEDGSDSEENQKKIEIVKSKGKKEKKEAGKGVGKEPAEKKKRYVLFVGNLPYSATVDDVRKHFLTKVSQVDSVRIPTRPGTSTPRGIAYVEFNNEADYQKGFSLHNSTLEGRRLNVQYTQGGSKDVGKRAEIVAKNKKLHALRKTGKFGGKPDNRNERRKKQAKA